MKIAYPNKYKINDEALRRIYPEQKDELGNVLTNHNLRYCYGEPDKKMNGEFWLMDENGIINPQMYTAELSESDLIN